MKKILITGKNSYIGTSFENWLAKNPDEYQVDTVGTRNDEWRDFDFSPYDVVFHVAGIAHIKETKKNEHLYYEVNRDLAYEIAKKAKEQGIKQFVFLSTMSVYGISKGEITEKTELIPKNAYGKSKLQAENLIKELSCNEFRVVIMRPPMVYGKNCRGNYTKISNFAKKTPIFPKIDNYRSMIFIDHLSQFTKNIIDNYSYGTYSPQNSQYLNTYRIVKEINRNEKRKVFYIPFPKYLIQMINLDILNKVFSDLKYDRNLSGELDSYNIYTFEETIKLSERGK